MKEGELLFVEATANIERSFVQESIGDAMYSIEPIEQITNTVMNTRAEIRKQALKTKEIADKEKILEKFNENIHDFYVSYLKGLMAMVDFEECDGIKPLSFLHWYTKYNKLLEFCDGGLRNFKTNTVDIGASSDFDIQAFILSGWDVFVYRLLKKPDDSFNLVEITNTTSIEETDWDGAKTKIGKEIIRRNGECGNKVFLFLYVENISTGRRAEKLLHFYSISVDGKEVRHYQHKERA